MSVFITNSSTQKNSVSWVIKKNFLNLAEGKYLVQVFCKAKEVLAEGIYLSTSSVKQCLVLAGKQNSIADWGGAAASIRDCGSLDSGATPDLDLSSFMRCF